MAKYSFSQINTYKQCPLKYKFVYIDRIPQPEQWLSAELLLWNSVHFALEKLYNSVSNFKTPELDEVVQNFNNYWNSEVEKALKEWKWEVNTHGDNTVDDYKTRGIEYLKSYYNNYHPFTQSKTVDTESTFVFQITDWVYFNWFIDRLDKDWSIFVINDYKTNKKINDKESHKEQLTLYWLGVYEKYWNYFTKLKARLVYLALDIVDEWELTKEMLDEVKQKYLSYIKEIELNKSRLSNWDKEAFKPCSSWLCRFCDFETICPLFTHAYYTDEVVDWLSEKTIKWLIDEYAELTKKKSEIEAWVENIKAMLIKYIDTKKEQWEIFKVLYWNKFKISFSNQPNFTQIDKVKFEEMIKELWLLPQILAISHHKVNALFKDWTLAVENFEGIIEKTESKRFSVWMYEWDE